MFHFKHFSLSDEKCAMKLGTDAVLLGSWAEMGKSGPILDVGTGSGILALMMAQRFNVNIDAIDIDELSTFQASENFALCPWHDRLKVIFSSYQLFLASQDKPYELILSNPPYFTNSLKSPDPVRCMARHNDILPPEAFMQKTGKLLSVTGKLSIIIPFTIKNLWIGNASIFGLFPSRITSIIPRQGKAANRVLIEFQKNQDSVLKEDFIEIKDSSGKYTEPYRQLTYDFYLDLQDKARPAIDV